MCAEAGALRLIRNSTIVLAELTIRAARRACGWARAAGVAWKVRSWFLVLGCTRIFQALQLG